MVGWTLVELDVADSTQSVAMGLAREGAPEGTTVVAKSQSSGRGRLGRVWASPAGGLYMSFLLRPVTLRRPELAAIVAAAAVAEGIRGLYGLEPTIRWPNDIMVAGKKLGGVVAQAQSSGAEVKLIVVGIGVNCNARVSLHDGETEATCLAEETGKAVEIAEVRDVILDSFSTLYDRWARGEDVSGAWASRLSTVGKEVVLKLKTGENRFTARATGVSQDGALEIDDGRRILPEELEWLRELA